MNYGIKAPLLAVAAVFTLTGCGLLDVDNPNSLVESSIQQEAAANGVANGSLRLVSDAVSSVWEAPAVVADELYWTGSRDAWGQLDQGFIGDPLNEFTDGAFPNLGQAVWMAQNAVDILEGHVANNPGDDDFAKDLARAQMFNGIILMVTGEIQDDMTFSDKQTDGAPVGPANMGGVIDRAIANLDAAVTGFGALAETELQISARALRARAHMSRAIWNNNNPTATVGTAMAFPAALADANAVIAAKANSDWKYSLTYSEAASQNSMASNVNNRGENQIDLSLVENTGPGASARTGVVNLVDPFDNAPDVTVAAMVTAFGDDQYGPLTLASERLMRLIVAEDALANGNTGTFETQINAIRALDSHASTYTYSAANAVQALTHHRRVNTLFMGLRLQDMYRWGLQATSYQGVPWDSQSEAAANPGEMLPITIIEIRANCNLNGVGCSS
jgi:hypothetical protein